MATQNAQPVQSGTQTPVPATIGAPIAPGQPGHNSDAVRQAGLQAWLDQCREFGEAAGKGDTSKVGWMQDMVERSFNGGITVDDAEKGVDMFTEARRKKAALLGKRVSSNDATSKGVRVSEAKKMIRLGALAQFREVNQGGLGVFNTALKVVGATPEFKGEASKLLLKVATEQLRKPEAPMDEDYIRQVLRPKDTEDKGEGELLHQAKKLIERAAKESSYDAHKRAAVASITARLEALGFKTAAERRLEDMAKRKAQKDKARAAAAKKKK